MPSSVVALEMASAPYPCQDHTCACLGQALDAARRPIVVCTKGRRHQQLLDEYLRAMQYAVRGAMQAAMQRPQHTTRSWKDGVGMANGILASAKAMTRDYRRDGLVNSPDLSPVRALKQPERIAPRLQAGMAFAGGIGFGSLTAMNLPTTARWLPADSHLCPRAGVERPAAPVGRGSAEDSARVRPRVEVAPASVPSSASLSLPASAATQPARPG
jgi:hypothetical protein